MNLFEYCTWNAHWVHWFSIEASSKTRKRIHCKPKYNRKWCSSPKRMIAWRGKCLQYDNKRNMTHNRHCMKKTSLAHRMPIHRYGICYFRLNGCRIFSSENVEIRLIQYSEGLLYIWKLFTIWMIVRIIIWNNVPCVPFSECLPWDHITFFEMLPSMSLYSKRTLLRNMGEILSQRTIKLPCILSQSS